jgi:hypothetical protein
MSRTVSVATKTGSDAWSPRRHEAGCARLEQHGIGPSKRQVFSVEASGPHPAAQGRPAGESEGCRVGGGGASGRHGLVGCVGFAPVLLPLDNACGSTQLLREGEGKVSAAPSGLSPTGSSLQLECSVTWKAALGHSRHGTVSPAFSCAVALKTLRCAIEMEQAGTPCLKSIATFR